jgi:electron transfer flavoprotein alpha subunit
MAVVVYLESQDGQIKKAALEVASYARAIADAQGLNVIGVGFNIENPEQLNSFGIDKLHLINTQGDTFFDVARYGESVAEIVTKEKAKLCIVSASANGRYLGPILAAKINAAYLSNVVSLPTQYEPLQVKRSCFTNKAFNITQSHKEITVLSLSSNSFGLKEKPGSAEVIEGSYASATTSLKVNAVDKTSDKVTIADADIVVSGGRGLKGPEHWHLIEDLADVLGAATACSKPVSDMGWRPHSEHVGQTGKPVASNLYIAIGVSGAIQHLAGINSSKIKVVINSDPEAPFFKAADYGVVGDAFEVVPKLTEKLKARKV